VPEILINNFAAAAAAEFTLTFAAQIIVGAVAAPMSFFKRYHQFRLYLICLWYPLVPAFHNKTSSFPLCASALIKFSIVFRDG
jgi:hypothetical protein